jgi:hypothetical protein
MTDLTRWRLKVDQGRQTWHYLSPEEVKDWPQTNYDKYWLGILKVSCYRSSTSLLNKHFVLITLGYAYVTHTIHSIRNR